MGIEIGSFNAIPSSIDGGCCMCYKHQRDIRNKRYLMVNDMATSAYMQINGRMEEFTLVSSGKNVFWYRNKEFSLKVKINKKHNAKARKSFNVNGTIVVTDLYKNKKKISFCGDCGW